MKKILLLLFILLPAICFAQSTIVLRSDTNSVYVGTFEHPKNTLRARYSDSGLAIFGTDNTVFIADRKYNTYTNASTGSTFTSFDTLKAWVRENFFVDAPSGTSGGGGDTATLTSVTTGAGNNITPNAIQIDGSSNLAITPSIALAYASEIGTITGIGTEFPSVALNTANGELSFATGQGSEVLVLNKISAPTDLLAEFGGRLRASRAVDTADAPNLAQVNSASALKVNKVGDTMSGLLEIVQNVATRKLILAMKTPGIQQDAPTALGTASEYLTIGGGEWNTNSYRNIGFGYRATAGSNSPGFIGYQETSIPSNTRGDIIMGGRPNNNDIAPSIYFRVRSDGQLLAESADYVPALVNSLVDKKYADSKDRFSDTTMMGTASTPSTTPQTILTIPIPTGKVFSVELRVVATTDGDPNEGAAYHNVVLSKNEAGTISVLGSMTTLHTPIITTNLALEGLIVSAIPSGTNLLIQVAMTTDNYTVSWKAYASIISL